MLENIESRSDGTVRAEAVIAGETYHLIKDTGVLEAVRLSDGLCKEMSPEGTDKEICKRVRDAFHRGPLFD
tara:strand:- start:225 stop:437 length:213 start_codon:yes stop_codon:yes gene_type:complete